jgi:hypothetical protein
MPISQSERGRFLASLAPPEKRAAGAAGVARPQASRSDTKLSLDLSGLLMFQIALLQDPRDARGTGVTRGNQEGHQMDRGGTRGVQGTPRGPKGTAGIERETKTTGGNNGGIGAGRKATRTQHTQRPLPFWSKPAAALAGGKGQGPACLLQQALFRPPVGF